MFFYDVFLTWWHAEVSCYAVFMTLWNFQVSLYLCVLHVGAQKCNFTMCVWHCGMQKCNCTWCLLHFGIPRCHSTMCLLFVLCAWHVRVSRCHFTVRFYISGSRSVISRRVFEVMFENACAFFVPGIQFEVSAGSVSGQFGVYMGSIWVNLGSIWDQSGIFFVSILGSCWAIRRLSAIPANFNNLRCFIIRGLD